MIIGGDRKVRLELRDSASQPNFWIPITDIDDKIPKYYLDYVVRLSSHDKEEVLELTRYTRNPPSILPVTVQTVDEEETEEDFKKKLTEESSIWISRSQYVIDATSKFYIDHVEKYIRYDDDEILLVKFFKQKEKKKRALEAGDNWQEKLNGGMGKRVKLEVEKEGKLEAEELKTEEKEVEAEESDVESDH